MRLRAPHAGGERHVHVRKQLRRVRSRSRGLAGPGLLPRGRGPRPPPPPPGVPGSSRLVEQRLADTQRSLAAVTAQNERLAQTLREARDQILTLKEEVDRLAQPPSGFGIFLQRNEDDSIDVFTGGRKLRVNVSPSVDLDDLRKGQEVMLNEALNVVAALDYERSARS